MLAISVAPVCILLAWYKGFEQGQQKQRDDYEFERKARERMLEDNGQDPTPYYFPKGKAPSLPPTVVPPKDAT